MKAFVGLMTLILCGCTTVPPPLFVQLAPPAPVKPIVTLGVVPDFTPAVQPDPVPTTINQPDSVPKMVHHKRIKTLTASPIIIPDVPVITSLPVVTSPVAQPDWSVPAIGGAVFIWAMVLVTWMWRRNA
jgi:hypothetical protein